MEKPIIFSTEIVQAILDNRKTMTRRVIKKDVSNRFDIDVDGSVVAYIDQATGDSYNLIDIAPYQVGDTLWVREAFCEIPYKYEHILIENGHITVPKIAYKVDSKIDYTGIWKPPIHMPKGLARIWLKITNVRIERLRDITFDDCISEGMLNYGIYVNIYAAFHDFWDKLNAKHGYGWDKNPWVWVIEFERVRR